MTTNIPTTYAEVIEEVTEGLQYDNRTQNYLIVTEAFSAGIWSTSDNAYQENGQWFIDGSEVAEEIQRRAAELGIEE